jgi:hypothetical protein
MDLRNIGILPQHYTSSQPRRPRVKVKLWRLPKKPWYHGNTSGLCLTSGSKLRRDWGFRVFPQFQAASKTSDRNPKQKSRRYSERWDKATMSCLRGWRGMFLIFFVEIYNLNSSPAGYKWGTAVIY